MGALGPMLLLAVMAIVAWLWFNTSLEEEKYDPQGAFLLLTQAGFRTESDMLKDRAGNRVNTRC